jgi:hypothetical protein
MLEAAMDDFRPTSMSDIDMDRRYAIENGCHLLNMYLLVNREGQVILSGTSELEVWHKLNRMLTDDVDPVNPHCSFIDETADYSF